MNNDINVTGGVKLPERLQRKIAATVNIVNDDEPLALTLQETLNEASPPYLSRIFTSCQDFELNAPKAKILLIDMTMVHRPWQESRIHENMMFWIGKMTEKHGYGDIIITSGLIEYVPCVAKDLQEYIQDLARVRYLGVHSGVDSTLLTMLEQ
jgi:hypothetical protein